MQTVNKSAAIFLFLLLSISLSAQTQVVAHRGFWKCEGSAQNSITALVKAADAGVYGSEFDVWITQDGVAVVNHNLDINGKVVENSTYKSIKKEKLSNGEKIPTLEQYLTEGVKHPQMKLILELKDHAEDINDDRAVAEVIRIVNKFHFFDNLKPGESPQIEFISFNFDMCLEFARAYPHAHVAFLTSRKSPKDTKDLGVPDLDYHFSALVNHPEWVKEAHDLGMKVNVWTVDDKDLMKQMIGLGVDFLTTNAPLEALELVK